MEREKPHDMPHPLCWEGLARRNARWMDGGVISDAKLFYLPHA